MLGLLSLIAFLPPEVPRVRVDSLSRGLEILHTDGEGLPVVDDFRIFRTLGFRSLRLPTERLPSVRAAIEFAKEASESGLAVELQVPDAREPAAGDLPASFRDFASLAPDLAMLNLGNLGDDAIAQWRAAFPETTFVVRRDFHSSPDPTPPKDSNAVVEAVLPLPRVFLVQGRDELRKLREVPYPSSPNLVAPLFGKVDETERELLLQYGRDRWNADRLRRQAQKIGDWGRKNKVYVLVGIPVPSEYGPSASRIGFMSDWRKALEENGLGWRVEDALAKGALFKGSAGQRTGTELMKFLGR